MERTLTANQGCWILTKGNKEPQNDSESLGSESISLWAHEEILAVIQDKRKVQRQASDFKRLKLGDQLQVTS